LPPGSKRPRLAGSIWRAFLSSGDACTWHARSSMEDRSLLAIRSVITERREPSGFTTVSAERRKPSGLVPLPD
jgi:hypothetical protein